VIHRSDLNQEYIFTLNVIQSVMSIFYLCNSLQIHKRKTASKFMEHIYSKRVKNDLRQKIKIHQGTYSLIHDFRSDSLTKETRMQMSKWSTFWKRVFSFVNKISCDFLHINNLRLWPSAILLSCFLHNYQQFWGSHQLPVEAGTEEESVKLIWKYSTIYITVCCQNHQTTIKIKTIIIKYGVFNEIWYFYYCFMNHFLQGTNYLIINIWLLPPRIYTRNINNIMFRIQTAAVQETTWYQYIHPR